MQKNQMLIFGVILLVLIGAGYLVYNSVKSEPAPEPLMMEEETTAETTQETSMMTGEIKVFEVNGSEFSYNIKEMRVGLGDTVRIVFTNTVGVHDWVLDEFNARTQMLQLGESETVEFEADQEGTFEYYCSVGNHRQLGMVGNLIVE